MFKKYTKKVLAGFLLGMAPFLPNIKCLPIFEEDRVVHKKVNDNEGNNALGPTDACRLSAHIPNKTTRKAIQDIEKGHDLVEVKNVKELLKKLGM